MSTSTNESIRRAAAVGIAGAVLSVISAAIVQLAVQPSTTVLDTRWSYPWSSDALVPVSLAYAALHAFVIVGLLGFSRSGLAGPSRTARVGLAVAVAGTALLLVGELASIPIRTARTDDTGAVIVGSIFGVAVALSAIGFLLAGRATMRAGLWEDWRRFTPLVTGLWMVVLVGVSFTKALPTGVGIYGLCLLVLFVALYTRPVPSGVPASGSTQPQMA
jgi:hypothetical protein